MSEVTTNGPNLYAQLAHRMRCALAEFNDDNRPLESLVSELAAYRRARLAQPAQAVDVGAGFHAMNSALCDFAMRWEIDGDYMRCRKCKRPQLTDYASHDFSHSADCKAAGKVETRPWETLVQLMAPLTRALSGEKAGRVDGWQPIETAPKDGSAILIADIQDGVVYDVLNGHFEVLAEDEDDGPWDIRDGEPWCSYEGRGAGIYFCHWLPGKEWESRWLFGHDSGYTHWMPLPASPSPDKEGM